MSLSLGAAGAAIATLSRKLTVRACPNVRFIPFTSVLRSAPIKRKRSSETGTGTDGFFWDQEKSPFEGVGCSRGKSVGAGGWTPQREPPLRLSKAALRSTPRDHFLV